MVRALQTFFARRDLVAITDEVLARAGRRFPAEPIRTLDAIHLATADILGDPPPLVMIVTRDERVRENARALGTLLVDQNVAVARRVDDGEHLWFPFRSNVNLLGEGEQIRRVIHQIARSDPSQCGR